MIEERRGEPHTSTRPGHRPCAPAEHGRALSYSAVKAVLNNLADKGRLEKSRQGKVTFFTLPTFTKSIALSVMQKGDHAGARDPKEFWKETFHADGDSKTQADKDRDRGREAEEEKSATPEKISGIGTEAFWIGSRVGGALYVLKGNSFIRLSIGGPDDQKTRIKKSKALAQSVLKHI